MDRIQRDFMNRQLSVIFEQMRLVKNLLEQMEMRLEEIEYECEEPIDFKVGFDWADDEDNFMRIKCDCPECQDDRSYRMD